MNVSLMPIIQKSIYLFNQCYYIRSSLFHNAYLKEEMIQRGNMTTTDHLIGFYLPGTAERTKYPYLLFGISDGIWLVNIYGLNIYIYILQYRCTNKLNFEF